MIEMAGGEDVLGSRVSFPEHGWRAAQAGADVVVVMPCGYEAAGSRGGAGPRAQARHPGRPEGRGGGRGGLLRGRDRA
jgi:hypothetical protein